MKPMLSGKVDDLSKVRFPVYCTPKLDGIRCLIHPELGPVSRTLKPIPNTHIRTTLAELKPGLDGEIMIPNAQRFSDVTSAVMRRSGEPTFQFWAFDAFGKPEAPYLERIERAMVHDWPSFVRVLYPKAILDEAALVAYENECLAQGFEGVMIRSAEGPYKFGRSTLREGYLLKLKRFEDSEAMVVGFEELLHNENEQVRDNLGHAKRSSAKAGKVPGGVLGKLLCRTHGGIEFAIGSGFTAEQREELWRRRGRLPGKLVKFKHQSYGAKDAPRIPIFLGFRHPEDM